MMVIFICTLFSLLISSLVEAKPCSQWNTHADIEASEEFFQKNYVTKARPDFAKIQLKPSFECEISENSTFLVEPLLILDPLNPSQSEKTFFDLPEARLRWKNEKISISIGNTIFNWGVTDGYNPLDILNPRQYFNPLLSQKLGSTAVSFSRYYDQWEFQFVYIPNNRPPILPGTESRWLPREVFIPQIPQNDTILNLPSNLKYQYADQDNLDHALEYNYAARTQWHGNTTDFGLQFFEGLAPSPVIQPVVTGTIIQVSPKTEINVDPEVKLNTKLFRIRQAGLTAVTNIKEILIKYELAHLQSIGSESLLPGWSQDHIFALEKTIQVGRNGNLTTILQHSSIISQFKNDSNLSTNEIFRSSFMLGGRLSWAEIWGVQFFALFDERHKSHLESFTIEKRMRDVWIIKAGILLVGGPKNSTLGTFDKNDSFKLSLSRSF